MTGFLSKLLGRSSRSSGENAKDRLQLILVHDRLNISPQNMELMKQEIIEVMSKYVSIDLSKVDFALHQRERENYLVAEIPVLHSNEGDELLDLPDRDAVDYGSRIQEGGEEIDDADQHFVGNRMPSVDSEPMRPAPLELPFEEDFAIDEEIASERSIIDDNLEAGVEPDAPLVGETYDDQMQTEPMTEAGSAFLVDEPESGTNEFVIEEPPISDEDTQKTSPLENTDEIVNADTEVVDAVYEERIEPEPPEVDMSKFVIDAIDEPPVSDEDTQKNTAVAPNDSSTQEDDDSD